MIDTSVIVKPVQDAIATAATRVTPVVRTAVAAGAAAGAALAVALVTLGLILGKVWA